MLKRRGDFVLDYLYPYPAANDFLVFFQVFYPSDIKPHRGVELQSISAGRRFGAPEHNADFHPYLIDKDNGCHRFRYGCSQLSESLAHETCLKSRKGITHIALYFRPGYKCCHGIDCNDVDGSAPYQELCNFKCLFARVGL